MTSTGNVGRTAKRLEGIKPSPIRAIFNRAAEIELAGDRIIHFEIGRPDFDTPEVVKQASIASLERGEVHYGPNAGSMDLRVAISDYLDTRRGTSYAPASEVVVTIGANEAVWLALMAYCQEGDEVIVMTPAWAHYESCVKLAGATPVLVPLRSDDRSRLDLPAIERALSDRTRMIIVCTPNNPTGTVVPRQDIEELASLMSSTDAILLSDEIYADLVYGEAEHVSPAALPLLYPRTLVVGGFAKAFAMDGWRLGWLAGPSDLIAPALQVRQYTTVCAPTFLQPGAAAALREAASEAEQMRLEFDERRLAGVAILQLAPHIQFDAPHGAFYFYIRYAEEIAEHSEQLALRLLEEHHVAVVPGTAFDRLNGSHSIRVSYACPLGDVVEGLTRIVSVLSAAPTTGVIE